MNRLSSGLIFTLCIIFSSNILASQFLNEEGQYRKCYIQFLKKYPSTTFNNSKRSSPAEDCLKLINLKNPNATRVIRTFTMFHAGWSKNNSFSFTNINWGTGEVLDPFQLAYYLNEALFNDRPYDTIVKGKEFFLPQRKISSNNTYDDLIYRSPTGIQLKKKNIKWNYGTGPLFPIQVKIPLMPRGQLVGWKKLNDTDQVYLDFYFIDYNDKKFSTKSKFFDSLGGGILGTSPYIILNHGNPIGTKVSSEKNIARKWSKSVLNDLLCKKLPVVDKEFSKNHVDKNSPYSFRKSKHCMACHITIDPMAVTIKDVVLGINNTKGYRFNDVNTEVIDQNLIFTYLVKEKNITKNLPESRLIIRDLDGKLINKPIKSLEDLGNEISKLDYFYACPVQRYFTFLTGIESTITASPANELEKYLYKVFTNFKEHKRLRILVKEIIQSKYFKMKNLELNKMFNN